MNLNTQLLCSNANAFLLQHCTMDALGQEMEEVTVLRDDLLTTEELRTKFGAGNYLVFFAMLLVSALIGVYFWWR